MFIKSLKTHRRLQPRAVPRASFWSLAGVVLLLGLFLSALGLPGDSLPAENDPLVNEISKAIREGNGKELAKHFNPTIEITLPGHEEVFSRTQAEQVVSDFFRKNKPSAFSIQHRSGPANARFLIGTLVTSTGNYRVYFLLKSQAGKTAIHLLKFEKE